MYRIMGLVILVVLAVAPRGTADNTLQLESSMETVGLFLDQCARPMVSGLPTTRTDLQTMNSYEARMRFGDNTKEVRTSLTQDITVIEGRNECRLGARMGDPELLRTAFNTIFDPGLTGFRRIRYERDNKGGFNAEYMRRDRDRTLTFRARVLGYSAEGVNQALVTISETSTRGRAR